MLFRTVKNIYDSGIKKSGSGAVYGPVKIYKACFETIRLLVTCTSAWLHMMYVSNRLFRIKGQGPISVDTYRGCQRKKMGLNTGDIFNNNKKSRREVFIPFFKNKSKNRSGGYKIFNKI
jgi:hypothetical protein